MTDYSGAERYDFVTGDAEAPASETVAAAVKTARDIHVVHRAHPRNEAGDAIDYSATVTDPSVRTRPETTLVCAERQQGQLLPTLLLFGIQAVAR